MSVLCPVNTNRDGNAKRPGRLQCGVYIEMDGCRVTPVGTGQDAGPALEWRGDGVDGKSPRWRWWNGPAEGLIDCLGRCLMQCA